MALNLRQKQFAEEYIIDFNATRAAVAAGYSEDTAYSQGHALTKNAEVWEHIQTLLDLRAERTRVTQDKVIRELARIAFADPRDYLEFGFNGVELRESVFLNADQAAAISEVSERRTQAGLSVGIKFHNKLDALEKLGKHLGMFVDKVDIKATVSNTETSDRDRLALAHFVANYAARAGKAPVPEKENYDDLV